MCIRDRPAGSSAHQGARLARSRSGRPGDVVTETAVVVHADAELLAQAVAARLIVKLVDAQASRGFASVVLTGGRLADATYRAVRDSPARDAINWSNVDFWWGDERFLPAGHTAVSYTHLRAHETPEHLVCRLLLE